MAVPFAMTPAAVAVNRFGLGARPDEPMPADPRRWLLEQFERYEARPAAWSGVPGTRQCALDVARQREQLRQAGKDEAMAVRQARRRDIVERYEGAVQARALSAVDTAAPWVERLTHFWANHFAISTEKPVVAMFAGAFEADAIRPHVLGRFHDMLLAVERHPAMLSYLDQVVSIGPGSPSARRAAERQPERRRGLNENLAREIMELHTLGARTGYSQDDVIEFARALTGWGYAGDRDRAAEPGGFVFRAALHEPGERVIRGKRYAQRGELQAAAVLRDLADDPQTARHLAAKLARHFVADAPPDALVDRLARGFLDSGGDLPTVYRALAASKEAWEPTPAKFKTPWDWMTSSLRGLGAEDAHGVRMAPLLRQLGQPVWRPGSPAGYDDVAASWAAPEALVRRVELAQRLASRMGRRLDPRALAPSLLGSAPSPATARAIAGSESPASGLALLLVSPEFQRR